MRTALVSPAWASEMTSRTPPSPRARRERRNSVLVLAVTHGQAQHLAFTGGGHPSGDHDGPGDDLMAGGVSRVDVGGVQEDVGELDVGEVPTHERGHLDIQVAADPGYLRFGDPRLHAQGLDQIVDLARRGAGHERFRHHRPQRLVDTAARLQQAREERPLPHLGDAHQQGFRPGVVSYVMNSGTPPPTPHHRLDGRPCRDLPPRNTTCLLQ